jgi:Domain of unknown function DUF11/Prealbumin-like fold domain
VIRRGLTPRTVGWVERRRPHLRRAAAIGAALTACVIVLSLVVLQPAVSQPNEKKVRICHATSSQTNPYISNEPAIANNGDLQGGHLNHTGPVFPADDWGDIIPPYTYTDQSGNEAVFPGRNWDAAGQAIWQNGCEPGLDPVQPIVECVEVGAGGAFLAHFGYENPNDKVVADPPENVFQPLSVNGQQPTTFQPGTHSDVFQVASSGETLRWFLTGSQAIARSTSPRCQGSITIVKVLNPSSDDGLFTLEIDGQTAGGAAAAGDGGTTGTIAVDSGSHTVGESGAKGTDLSLYDIQISCLSSAGVVAEGSGARLSVPVKLRQAVVCTITNTLKEAKTAVAPVLECVVFRGAVPDVAVWGYSNPAAFPVTLPFGSSNGFTPVPLIRGQPSVFDPGRLVGAFQTPFAGGATLTWRLGNKTVTASSASSRCTASLELRKVTVPANDPGVFNLLINGATVITGPNGTTTGALTVGVGEGTVRETAAPGTNLGDYRSRVDCTRNGQPAVSVAGTKVDGAVANGDVVVCTFTNTRTAPLPSPLPPAPPIPPPPTDPPIPVPPPAPTVDLGVRKTATPTIAVLGQRITFRVTVTNLSPFDADDVNVVRVSERSYRLRVLSLMPSQGSCTKDSCNLGRLASRESATITVVTQSRVVGRVLNVVSVSSEERETDYLNNTASALVRITDPPSEAKKDDVKAAAATIACHTLTVGPRALQAGATSIVLASARSRYGRPLPGMPVIAEGEGVRVRVLTDRRGIAHIAVTPRGVGIVHFRRARLSGSPCRTLLGVLGSPTTSVTG